MVLLASVMHTVSHMEHSCAPIPFFDFAAILIAYFVTSVRNQLIALTSENAGKDTNERHREKERQTDRQRDRQTNATDP